MFLVLTALSFLTNKRVNNNVKSKNRTLQVSSHAYFDPSTGDDPIEFHKLGLCKGF